MVGHKAPHSFYTPEPRYERTFEDVRVSYPETAFMLADKPAWIEERLRTWHGIYGPLFDWRRDFPDDRPEAVADFAAMMHAYWGTILSVDDSVGRLIRLLEQRGELENTIVVFMSDNGILAGEHGMVDKRTMHEPSIRIPMIVRYPALTPRELSRIVEQQVLTIDVAPSILELCGASPLEGIHGRSWVQLVRDGDPTWRESWFYYYNYEPQFPYTPNVRALRTESWKYVRYPNSPKPQVAELYDLQGDPDELVNLIGDPRQRTRAKSMHEELDRQLIAIGAWPDVMPLDEGIGQQLPDANIR
jgi:N-acetylglucosamine-6-sulfatase